MSRDYYLTKKNSTFNRTSMELKHVDALPAAVSELAFNRTSMELKRVSFTGAADTGAGLLIEPVWN